MHLVQIRPQFPQLDSAGLRMASAVGARQNRAAAQRLDLASEATLGLLESQRRFDARRGTRLTTFAYARMRGRALDAVRAEARYLRAREHTFAVPEAAEGPSISERLDAWRTVERVSDELPSCERIVLRAVYGQDRPLREVAQQGRWSEDQLQRAHQRLLQRLRAAVGLKQNGLGAEERSVQKAPTLRTNDVRQEAPEKTARR